MGITLECHVLDISLKLFAFDGHHFRTNSRLTIALVLVHSVQGDCKRVGGVADEMQRRLLLVAGLLGQFFVSC